MALKATAASDDAEVAECTSLQQHPLLFLMDRTWQPRNTDVKKCWSSYDPESGLASPNHTANLSGPVLQDLSLSTPPMEEVIY